MKPTNLLFITVAFFGTVFFLGSYDEKVGVAISNEGMLASVFFTQSTTSANLQATFESASSSSRKLNILIVPGHEPNFGGTEYRGILERDLNADLSQHLAQYLVEDGHYNVVITRGRDGWNPDIQDYFTIHKDEIKTFERTQKVEMARLVEEGKIIKVNGVVLHNDAPDSVALHLFGINKWANDNHIDIIIHIHFNDDFPRTADTPGGYNGFAIYTPEHQYSNSQATVEVAENIFKRLSQMFPVSSLPQEEKGIIEDQDLIAVGSNNSVNAASMVIEYGYIYEPQFKVPNVRAVVLKELALQTYLGVADFFGKTSLLNNPYESTLLPYEGKNIVKKMVSSNIEVLAFQAALSNKGFYPPKNFTRNECPLSGLFGPCTRAALSAFQYQYDIKNENGVIGIKTRAQLRKLFKPKLISEM